ncbi:hypothetical protein ANAPC5_01461 [Anaplasma phagocytophilum]|nr:hypothetical protein ANAPC5_01461 [Anaplasma phagocytophilum]
MPPVVIPCSGEGRCQNRAACSVCAGAPVYHDDDRWHAHRLSCLLRTLRQERLVRFARSARLWCSSRKNSPCVQTTALAKRQTHCFASGSSTRFISARKRKEASSSPFPTTTTTTGASAVLLC